MKHDDQVDRLAKERILRAARELGLKDFRPVAGGVLSQILTDEQTLTADNADLLAGTILDQPGVPGVYTVFAASTVGDTQITISIGGRQVINAGIITLRANSEIREDSDTFYQMISLTGGRPVVNVNVITAATVRVRTKFLPAGPT